MSSPSDMTAQGAPPLAGEERKEGERERNRVVEMSEGHCGEMVLTNHAVTNRHCLPLITHLPSAIGRGERTLHHIWKPLGERVGSRNLGEVFLGVNKPHKRLTSLSLFAPRLNRLGLCCHCLGFGKGSSASVREGGMWGQRDRAEQNEADI